MMLRVRGMNIWEKLSDNWMIIYLEEILIMYVKFLKESVRERVREIG